MDNKTLVYKIFEAHVPENVIHYCFDLWEQYNFNFIITRKRQTKLGDYRYNGTDKSHTITINHDLNKYSFLVTYLHEIAHLITYSKFKSKALPHGKEWKHNFREIVQPVLNDLVFPPDLLVHISQYILNPKASSCTDHSLSIALAAYDKNDTFVHLSEVNTGTSFRFNRKIYQKEMKRRTRIICKEVSSGRRFLISQIAKVELITG